MWDYMRGHRESVVVTKELRNSIERGGIGYRQPIEPLPANIVGTHNSVLHQIPIVNLGWSFLDSSNSKASTWPQIAFVLESISILAALLLALSILLQSAVTYDELQALDARFEVLADNSTNGHRSIANFDLNGGYADWWFGTKKGQQGGDCTSDDCTARTFKISEKLNEFSVMSSFLLSLSSLVSLSAVFVGSVTPVANESANVNGAQFTKVMSQFMKIIKIVMLVSIATLVIGTFYVLFLLQSVVFLKFPDTFVETYWHSNLYPGQLSSYYTVYGFANGQSYFYLWLPMLIGLFFLAIAQRAAYTYPMTPPSASGSKKMCGMGQEEDEERNQREASHAILTRWLIEKCSIPSVNPSHFYDNGDVKEEEIKTINYNYTYLTCAGGSKTNEAEIIADIFIDAGIMNVTELLTFIQTGDDRIYELEGLSLAAASQIVWQANFESENVKTWWEFTPADAQAFEKANFISQVTGVKLQWNGFLCKFVPEGKNVPTRPANSKYVKGFSDHPDVNKVRTVAEWNVHHHGEAFRLDPKAGRYTVGARMRSPTESKRNSTVSSF